MSGDGPGVGLHGYTIPGPAGALEVLYRSPPSGAARGGALICHPHPRYGGSLHSRVVFHLARAFGEAAFATLRFNFRGVGRSEGEHDDGGGEVDDALAALDHLESLHREQSLAVAGHSFGAWVGLRAGRLRRGVHYLVGAGVPVSLYDFRFLEEVTARLLVLQGDGDDLGPAAALQEASARWPRGARLVVLEGADHFFAARLHQLRARVREFLAAKQS